MALSLLRKATLNSVKHKYGAFIQIAHISDHERNMIGRREIVGFGYNGNPNYCDRDDFPFSSIRFREPTAEIQALREKEKGDWNELTCDEKKKLYRYSFCQTFSEFQVAQTGEWKFVVASAILFTIIPAFYLFMLFRLTIYRADPLPESFSDESRAAQFRRALDLKMNPISGLASKWDYEKDDWKDPRDPWRPRPK